jgi:hypothetical protein
VGKKQVPLLKKGKHKKHDLIVNDFENQKRKQLEKLSTQMLENQEKFDKLREKNINTNFLNLWD